MAHSEVLDVMSELHWYELCLDIFSGGLFRGLTLLCVCVGGDHHSVVFSGDHVTTTEPGFQPPSQHQNSEFEDLREILREAGLAMRSVALPALSVLDSFCWVVFLGSIGGSWPTGNMA